MTGYWLYLCFYHLFTAYCTAKQVSSTSPTMRRLTCDETAEFVCKPFSAAQLKLYGEGTELVCTSLSSSQMEGSELVCTLSPHLPMANMDQPSSQNTEWNHLVDLLPLQQPPPSLQQEQTAHSTECQQNQLSTSRSGANFSLAPQLEVGVECIPLRIAMECTSPWATEELVVGRL